MGYHVGQTFECEVPLALSAYLKSSARVSKLGPVYYLSNIC